MRQSQLYGQVFIYILTILLISFILIYGYNAISGFKGRTEQIVSLKLQEELKNSVQSITPDFGSAVKKEIDIGSASEICFVENFQYCCNRASPVGKDSSGSIIVDPIIKDSIKSNDGNLDHSSDKNVFLIGKSASSPFNIGYIKLDESTDPGIHINVLCMKPLNGKVTLKLEGKGDHALVSAWA
ncbi:MAG TPA: hypothetical protein VJI52_00510 [Candidatus Nanoarchaeia archaeon]|nr:hypothetical protein [Candidatus Nanoarchaeia archaeon]